MNFNSENSRIVDRVIFFEDCFNTSIDTKYETISFVLPIIDKHTNIDDYSIIPFYPNERDKSNIPEFFIKKYNISFKEIYHINFEDRDFDCNDPRISFSGRYVIHKNNNIKDYEFYYVNNIERHSKSDSVVSIMSKSNRYFQKVKQYAKNRI